MKQEVVELLSGAAHLANPAALLAWLTKGKIARTRHQDLISDKCVDAVLSDSGRLIVNTAPQHGKSSIVSLALPTWYLSLMPDRYVMLLTYAAEYAAEWGRRVRNTITEHWPDLGITLAEDSKARHRWNTRHGGGMIATGIIDGQVTGRPAHLIVIDDPVKSGREALSPTIQRETWQAYKSTIRPRLRPGGSIVLIQTRWADEDLTGQLLAAQAAGPAAEGYDEWDHVLLPAIAEEDDALGRKPGEALWPEAYTIQSLRSTERSIGPHWFAAEYQQRPTPLGGDFIKEHWWNYWVPAGSLADWPPVVLGGRECRIVELPPLKIQVQSWDMNFRDSVRAIEKGKEPDAVSGQVVGRSEADLFWLDRWCNRVGLTETIEAVRLVSRRNPEAKIKFVENAANGPAVMAKLHHEVGGFVPNTPIGSKIIRVIGDGSTDQARGARAVSFASSVRAGNCYLPHPGLYSWVAEFRGALGRFPKSGKDDTDAASQAWARLEGEVWRDLQRLQREAEEKGPPPKTPMDVFRRQMREALTKERGKGETAHANRFRRAR